jgi:hypothetical protein
VVAPRGQNGAVTSDGTIDLSIPPSGTGCVECLATGGWWFHLRRCVQCGHIGCCDQSPSQHTSKHAAAEHHPIIRSFEPDEDWFYDYDQDGRMGPPQCWQRARGVPAVFRSEHYRPSAFAGQVRGLSAAQDTDTACCS